MKKEQFDKIIKEQLKRCQDILVVKGEEYSTEDRLHNFRRASGLTNESMEKTLSGMMLKHTVSIYDMCHSDQVYSDELWDEKITDHINYLLLLKAVTKEEKDA